MAAEGRGTMRPQSRSPPFLLIGLVVALVILGANYWNLSSNNASLSSEVTDLQDQLRIASSKRINSERRGDNAMKRIRDIEAQVNKYKEELDSKKEDVKRLKEEQTKTQTEKESCTSKLKLNEENMNGIQQELQKYKDEAREQETKKEVDNLPNCTKVCNQAKMDLFTQMEKLGLQQVLATLKENGIDILDFKDRINVQPQNQKGGAPQQQSGDQQNKPNTQQQQSNTQQQPQAGAQQQQPGAQQQQPVAQQQQPDSHQKQQGEQHQQSGSQQQAMTSTKATKGTPQGVTTNKPVAEKQGLMGFDSRLSKNDTNKQDFFKASNNFVGDGIQKVLQKPNVRMMHESGVIEMKQKPSRLVTGNKKQTTKKEEEDNYIDNEADLANDDKKADVKMPKKPLKDQNEADYEDETDKEVEVEKKENKNQLKRKLDSIERMQQNLVKKN